MMAIECLRYVMIYVKTILAKMFPPPCPECGHFNNNGSWDDLDCPCCKLWEDLEEWYWEIVAAKDE
jgi:hypothetical protein